MIPRIIGRTLLVGIVLMILLWLVREPVHSKERPTATTVEIAVIKGDAGFYVGETTDGRLFLAVPLSRKAPALVIGVAVLNANKTQLTQGGYTYHLKSLRAKR